MGINIVVRMGVVTAWLIVAATLILGRRARRGARTRSRSSWGALGLALQVVGMAIAWGRAGEGGAPLLASGSRTAWLLAAAAVGLAWASAAFACVAVRTLGRYWSLLPRTVEDHDLVQEGPYSIVRHPIYTALLGLLVATGLAFSRIEALLAAMVVYLVGTEIRIRLEDRLLRATFGERFDRYARRVPALLPFPRARRTVAILLLAAAPAGAQEAPAGWSAFVRAFDTYAEAGGIVGASALVMRDGRVLARHHLGFADLAAGRPVDERTIFHYGSITKTLNAIAVLQLRDRGLLDLDDPVTRWVPELRAVHDPYGSPNDITLRMLLAHTAGFQGSTWPWDGGEPWEPFEPTEWAQLVAMMPYQRLLFAPGTRYSYSNPGVLYLARVVERISGDPWAAYVQKNLFAPLGLARSYFGATPYHLAADRSHNYELRTDSLTGKLVPVDEGADFDPGITIPNGGWNAPLDDVAAYLAFLTGPAPDPETGRIRGLVLPRQTLEEMWEPQASVEEDGTGFRWTDVGLSFFVEREPGGRRIVGHTGSQANFRSFLAFDPERRTAWAMVFNTSVDEGPDPGAAELQTLLSAARRLLD